MENTNDVTQFRNEVNYGQDLLILILHVQDELRYGRNGNMELLTLRNSLLDEISEYVEPELKEIETKYDEMYKEAYSKCLKTPYSYSPDYVVYQPTKDEDTNIRLIPIIRNTKMLNRIINALNKFGILLHTIKQVETGKEPTQQL